MNKVYFDLRFFIKYLYRLLIINYINKYKLNKYSYKVYFFYNCRLLYILKVNFILFLIKEK